jgi:hypothetical protein
MPGLADASRLALRRLLSTLAANEAVQDSARAADDDAAIRTRMEELKRERQVEEKRAKRAAVEEEKLRPISEELRSRIIPRR